MNIKSWLICIVILPFALLGTGCALTPAPQPKADELLTKFVASEYQDNPLVGRFWSIADQAFVDWSEVKTRLPLGGWVLLGEQHDNPDHHRAEVAWVEHLAVGNRLGSVAIEQASRDVQPQLDAALGKGSRMTPEDLSWDGGWPWSRYGDLVRTALSQASRLVAANLSKDDRASAYKGGAPGGEFSAEHSAFMIDLIDASHCRMLPKEAAVSMLQLQLARDQMLAQKLMENTLPDKISLFVAGGNHVRRDLGVPLWLSGDVPYLSVLMQGVAESTEPLDYLPTAFDQQPVADLIYFTPGLPPKDHCAAFRQ